MKKIYLTAFVQKNFGDDLFVKIICERYPKTKFYISCSRFTDTAFEKIENLTIMNRKHLKGMIIQNFKRFLTKLKLHVNYPFDGQVYIGGSIFIEPPSWNENHCYESQLYQYKLNKGLPYFILGANFGPHTKNQFAEIHKEFFRKEVLDICFRDKQSYQLFAELENTRFAPDIVCTYTMPQRPKEDLILISCIYNNEIEGVEAFDNDSYADKMAEVCRKYSEHGKKVCLLSLCNMQNDHLMCRKIQEKLSDSNVFIKCYDGNIEEIIDLFSRAEYVIASRFHAMVLAWLARIPVFPISYNNKTKQVIEDYCFEGRYCPIGEFASLDFEEIHESLKKHYVFDIRQISEDAQKQFAMLDRFLKGEQW